MSSYIIVQSTYSTTQVALYHSSQLITSIPPIDQASTSLIPVLDELLKKNNTALNSLDFIGAYQGPGPFTTLRVILASVNGIAFANNIPLIGIDGLDALLEEHTHEKFPVTVALLNAYNKDAYFGIQHNGVIAQKGYRNIIELLNELQQKFRNAQIRFIGQGVEIFKDNIQEVLGSNAYIPSPLPEVPSMDILAHKALSNWQQGLTSSQLLPLYLKTLKYKKSINP